MPMYFSNFVVNFEEKLLTNQKYSDSIIIKTLFIKSNASGIL